VVIHVAPTRASAAQVLEQWTAFMESDPPHVASLLGLPCGAPVVVTLGAVAGQQYAAAKSYADVPELVRLAAVSSGWFSINQLKPMDYHLGVQRLAEPNQTPGYMAVGGFTITKLTREVREVLLDFSRDKRPNNHAFIGLFGLGARVRNAKRPHASGHRDGAAWVLIEGRWFPGDSHEQVERVKQWVLDLRAELARLDGAIVGGAHGFFTGDTENFTFYGEVKAFLKQTKRAYDPDNVFRGNVNVAPA